MTPEHPPEQVYDAVLQVGGAVVLTASAIVTLVSRRLVAREAADAGRAQNR